MGIFALILSRDCVALFELQRKIPKHGSLRQTRKNWFEVSNWRRWHRLPCLLKYEREVTMSRANLSHFFRTCECLRLLPAMWSQNAEPFRVGYQQWEVEIEFVSTGRRTWGDREQEAQQVVHCEEIDSCWEILYLRGHDVSKYTMAFIYILNLANPQERVSLSVDV